MAHLSYDEARIDRSRAHDARQSRRQRACARPLRIGHIQHHQVDRTAEQLGRRGKAADEGGIFGTFQQIACGIVTNMHKHVGTGDALRESAWRRSRIAVRAAVSMRGSSEIGRADDLVVGVLADQILDARPVDARRGAEDAIQTSAVGAVRLRQRVLIVGLIARRDRLHRGVDQRDLRRE